MYYVIEGIVAVIWHSSGVKLDRIYLSSSSQLIMLLRSSESSQLHEE